MWQLSLTKKMYRYLEFELEFGVVSRLLTVDRDLAPVLHGESADQNSYWTPQK